MKRDSTLDAFLTSITEPDLADVWCSKCEAAAVRTIELTSGERNAYCVSCAWVLIAPSGSGVARPSDPS